VAGGEHLAGGGLLQHPLQRFVAATPEIRSDAGPIEMHVDAERSRRRVVSKAALLPANLGQVHSASAEFPRHIDGKVPDFLQVPEIFFKEPVLAIVAAATLGETNEHLFRKDRGGSSGFHLESP